MAETRTFDDRDGWIWFDGQLVPWREANVHVLSHALHYASSVFEGRAPMRDGFQAPRALPASSPEREILVFEIPWTSSSGSGSKES